MAEPLPDYYALLHVDAGAPDAVIRASYRTLMQRLRAHPDLGGDHDAAALLNAAYATLRDPRRRAEYDARRAAEHGRQGSSAGRDRGPRPAGSASDGHAAASARTDATARPPAHVSTQALPPEGTYTASAGWMRGTAVTRVVDFCAFCGTASADGRGQGHGGESCRRCNAPLTPPVRGRDADASQLQRSVYRIAKAEPLRIFVSLEDRTGAPALVHDISVTGMRFSCERAFSAGTIVRCECAICAAVVRVAYGSEVSQGVRQYGAEFLTIRFKRQRGSLLSVPA